MIEHDMQNGGPALGGTELVPPYGSKKLDGLVPRGSLVPASHSTKYWVLSTQTLRC